MTTNITHVIPPQKRLSSSLLLSPCPHVLTGFRGELEHLKIETRLIDASSNRSLEAPVYAVAPVLVQHEKNVLPGSPDRLLILRLFEIPLPHHESEGYFLFLTALNGSAEDPFMVVNSKFQISKLRFQ